MDIETFKEQLKAGGYTEVLEKSYAPNTFIDTHSHPFFARAILTDGEMEIACGEEKRRYAVGDIFELDAGRVHTEKYGPNGAKYLVGRRTP
ncbi:MAG: cupin [Burkholderiaceae bacterium]|jgi:quercetin dioxygenase-like cupin family protein